MTTQWKTLKAKAGTDNIKELEGDASYSDPTSQNFAMQVNQHPWCAPDGVSLVISGGLGSTETATFIDGTGVNYTITSNPVTEVEINGMPFAILP